LQNRRVESIGNYFRVPYAAMVRRGNSANSLNVAALIHIDGKAHVARA
jgi:hypothetical protein